MMSKTIVSAMAVMSLGFVLSVVKGHGDEMSFSPGNFSRSKPCTNPQCVVISADILSSIDPQANPCADMYQYACGKWGKDHSVPRGFSQWNAFSDLDLENGKFLRKLLDDDSTLLENQQSTAVRKLKSYYKSCMDTATLEAKGTTGIKELIKECGPWTVSPDVSDSTWEKGQWNFQRSLVATHLKGARSFFSVDIGVDAKDSSTPVLLFSQSGLTLSAPMEYTGDKSQEFKEAFLSFAVKLGVLLGGVEEDVRIKMEKVYNLEKKLSQIHVPAQKLTDPHETYNKMSLGEFQDLIGPSVHVGEYLSFYFDDRMFLPTETVVVSTPKYFEMLGPILKETNKEVLANYMMWMLVKPLTTFLPKAFLEARLPLTEAENGVAALPERWQICFALSTKAVGFAASALFVERKFNPASKEKVVSVLQKVTDKFIKNLDLHSWLDKTSRDRFKEKARAVSFKVGYPDWILAPQILDKYYEKLMVENDEFLENGLQVTKFVRRKLQEKYRYGKPSNKAEWKVFPHAVNAFYDENNNQVTVPAGLLQPPFFYSSNTPKSLLYSGIGTLLGHELTQAFDDHGQQFDKSGNLDDQWTKATSSEFQKKAKCMKKQYTTLQQPVDGKFTLREYIADNGGLLFAYEAFKDDQSEDDYQLPGLHFSQDQMFFLGFSQLWCSLSSDSDKLKSRKTAYHTVGEVRVNGVLSNHFQFAAAFNCPLGSPMHPTKTCRVW